MRDFSNGDMLSLGALGNGVGMGLEILLSPPCRPGPTTGRLEGLGLEVFLLLDMFFIVYLF